MTVVINPNLVVVEITPSFLQDNSNEPTVAVGAYHDDALTNLNITTGHNDDYVDSDDITDELNTAFTEEGNDEAGTDDEDMTLIPAVHRAVLDNDLETLKTLHQSGKDIHALDSTGIMAVDYASDLGYRAIEQYLAHDLFLEAASRGDVVLLDKALGLFESNIDLSSITDSRGATAMHLAAENCDLAMVTLLHAKGISVDVEDNRGQAPLDYIGEDEGITSCGIFLMSQHVATVTEVDVDALGDSFAAVDIVEVSA